MKKIEIIPLARKKIKKRNIPEKWIEESVNDPMQVVKGYKDRNIIHRKYTIDDKEYLLRVVYEKEEDTYIIITAYLTSDIKRYWK